GGGDFDEPRVGNAGGGDKRAGVALLGPGDERVLPFMSDVVGVSGVGDGASRWPLCDRLAGDDRVAEMRPFGIAVVDRLHRAAGDLVFATADGLPTEALLPVGE